MDTYAYLNSVLDAKPQIVVLKLNTDAHAVAVGPVPDGQQDLQARVTVQSMPTNAVPGLCIGYDSANKIVAQFYC